MLMRLSRRRHGSVNLQGHSKFMELLYGQHLAFSLVGDDTITIYEKHFLAEGCAKPNFSCI